MALKVLDRVKKWIYQSTSESDQQLFHDVPIGQVIYIQGKVYVTKSELKTDENRDYYEVEKC
jgi:hypothetical protein